MIEDYLGQKVLWKSRTGTNDWGDPSYADPVEIPARVEEMVRVMAGTGGSEIRATNEVLVTEDVKIGDLVNWQDLDPDGSFDEVQARNAQVDVFGEAEGWVLFFEPTQRQ